MINFVNTGVDDAILKSMPTEDCSEDLIKAMNKQGLVQKDVTVQGKNGKTFTRKQWVKASDVKSTQFTSKVTMDFSDAKKVRTSLRKIISDLGYTAPQYRTTSVRGFTPISKHGVKIAGLVEPLKSDDKTLFITCTNDKTRNEVLGKIKKELGNRGIKVIGPGEKGGCADGLTVRLDKQESSQPTSQPAPQTAQVAQTPQQNKQPQQQSGSKLSKEDAKKKTQSFTSKIGKSDAERNAFMDKVKAQGISWKEDEHAGINWMRCCMAMNKHFAEGGSFDASTKDTKDTN